MHSQVCITRHMLFDVAAKIVTLSYLCESFDIEWKQPTRSCRMFPCICSLFTRSQMMSKCGKNKKVAHDLLVKWVTDALTNKGVKNLKL